jgi:hypothetical protein
VSKQESVPKNPIIFLRKGQDLSISGGILLDLMQSVLAKEADFKFRARGLSMTPFIKDGDIITISPLSKENPSTGRVVAFTRPDNGQLVVHRVIGKQGSEFLIQGDNITGRQDELIPLVNILGCVTKIERGGHRIFLGMGPERFLIAAMSRNGFLSKVIDRLRAFRNKSEQ